MFRKFVAFSSCVLLVMLLVAGCGSGDNNQSSTDQKNEETVVLKVAHANIAKHPMGVAFEKFKEMVESRSNGSIKVEVFDSGKFGGTNEMMQGVQTNTLQMCSMPTPYLVSYENKFAIFDMPFLFPSYESTDKITDGPIGMELANSLKDRNITGLGYIEIGFRNIFNNKKAVEKLEDAKGLKIRATGSKSHIATLQSFGINATSVAWGEVYTAMQQKTVDGIDIDINLATFNKFNEVNKYVTLTRSLYTPHLVLVNDDFLGSLTPENKKIIVDSFEEMKVFERDLNRSLEDEGINSLKEEGTVVTELTPEERQRWVEASKVVYDNFKDIIGEDLLEEVKNTVAE